MQKFEFWRNEVDSKCEMKLPIHMFGKINSRIRRNFWRQQNSLCKIGRFCLPIFGHIHGFERVLVEITTLKPGEISIFTEKKISQSDSWLSFFFFPTLAFSPFLSIWDRASLVAQIRNGNFEAPKNTNNKLLRHFILERKCFWIQVLKRIFESYSKVTLSNSATYHCPSKSKSVRISAIIRFDSFHRTWVPWIVFLTFCLLVRTKVKWKRGIRYFLFAPTILLMFFIHKNNWTFCFCFFKNFELRFVQNSRNKLHQHQSFGAVKDIFLACDKVWGHYSCCV